MVSFTNSGLKDVYISGPTKTFVASGRIPFGSALIRAGSGTVKAAALQDIATVIGFACSDEEEHTYDGFYESGEVVRVALGGSRVNANLAYITSATLLAGDYLGTCDLGATITSAMGLLYESAATAGETRAVTSCAKLLEDVTIGSDTYKVPAATPTAGDTTVTMTSGDTTLMGLQVGEFIALVDENGTVGELNRITSLTDTVIGVEIPIVATGIDMVHWVKQAEVLVIT